MAIDNLQVDLSVLGRKYLLPIFLDSINQADKILLAECGSAHVYRLNDCITWEHISSGLVSCLCVKSQVSEKLRLQSVCIFRVVLVCPAIPSFLSWHYINYTSILGEAALRVRGELVPTSWYFIWQFISPFSL